MSPLNVWVVTGAVALAPTPIGQQTPNSKDPWGGGAECLIADRGGSVISHQVPIPADQMIFRVLFPKGGPLLQATQLSNEADELVIEYGPAVQLLVDEIFREAGRCPKSRERGDELSNEKSTAIP